MSHNSLIRRLTVAINVLGIICEGHSCRGCTFFTFSSQHGNYSLLLRICAQHNKSMYNALLRKRSQYIWR